MIVEKEYYTLFSEITDEMIEWIKSRIEYYSNAGSNIRKKEIFKLHLKNFQNIMKRYKVQKETCLHTNMDYNKWNNLSERKKCPDCGKMILFYEVVSF